MAGQTDIPADSRGGNPLRRAVPMGGGAVPGLEGAVAFRWIEHAATPIPIVLAAPHAGRAYPREVIAALRAPEHVLLRLEDRLVDQLALAVAVPTLVLLV